MAIGAVSGYSAVTYNPYVYNSRQLNASSLNAIKPISDDATDGIQKDINQAWDDYEKSKSDAIHDINKFFDDYGIIPMFKIGFMYRF